MGQVNDWMNEIYPRWVAAHGVMIVTPVYWYQAPSVLKLMIDRLVCADGGNPDPTTTRGKNPEKAKALELERLAAIRAISPAALFAVVVHGDAAGAETLRRSLTDWLTGHGAGAGRRRARLLDRYVGYYEPYATSHDALDRDTALSARKSATRQGRSCEAVTLARSGNLPQPDPALRDPRPK